MNSHTKSSSSFTKLKLLFNFVYKIGAYEHTKIKRLFPFLKLISVPLENERYLIVSNKPRSLEP